MKILNTSMLNREQAISLKNDSSIKNEKVKQVEAQAKELIKNTPADKSRGDSSVNPAEIKLTVTGEMAHFDFINHMEELSTDEKRNISRLIQQSVSKPNGGTGDYFIMDRAQTIVQLHIIADKLIPDKYKDQMNEAIKNYQDEGFIFHVAIYEAAQASMDNLSTDFPSLGKKSFISNGTKTLQEQEKWMYGMYNELGLSSQSKFVTSFESILTNFKDQQLQVKNSSEEVLNRFQNELRTKWNDFASMLNDSNVYKLSTAENSVIDVRL